MRVEFLSNVADVVTVHTGLVNSHQASNNPIPLTQNSLLSILECACASATFRYKSMCRAIPPCLMLHRNILFKQEMCKREAKCSLNTSGPTLETVTDRAYLPIAIIHFLPVNTKCGAFWTALLVWKLLYKSSKCYCFLKIYITFSYLPITSCDISTLGTVVVSNLVARHEYFPPSKRPRGMLMVLPALGKKAPSLSHS